MLRKQKLQNFVLPFMMSFSVLLGSFVYANEPVSDLIQVKDGVWIFSSAGWWYRHEDGSYTSNSFEQIGNKTYYFNSNGYMVTGWKQINKTWYYFDASGVMKTGWIQLNNIWYYLDSEGKMVTGWQIINGFSYYFNPQNGAMVIDKFIDGKYLGEDGRYLPERIPESKWIKDSTGWWYRHQDGNYTTNDFEKIGSNTYYFNDNGYMVTGWQLLNNTWYYFDASGAMKTGWIKLNNIWYYLDSEGKMLTGWQKINNRWYYFNSSGLMQVGWKKIDNQWYYMTINGDMKTGWLNVNGKWYYLNSNGSMKTGWLQLKGYWYYLDGDGAMLTGWNNIGNVLYYFDSSGVMRKDSANPTYVNGIMIVNKKYPLSSNYNPGENSVAGAQIRKLIRDMQNSGYSISSSYSGFRSYTYQNSLYWGYVNSHGQSDADTFSARAGYSEHQTGLAFDLIHSNGSLVTTNPEVTWIANNAHKYGFIVRYKSGKEHITGYQAEPWHLRYVGDEATKIYQSGLTLEEYLGVAGGNY